MEIRDIEAEDLPICLEYLEEEWVHITGSDRKKANVSMKMEAAMTGEPGAVLIVAGRIIGFAVIEEGDEAVMLVSFYIANGFRKSVANYMLMKYVIDFAGERNIAYCSLHPGMTLPGSVCNEGRVDKNVVNRWLNVTKSRFDKE